MRHRRVSRPVLAWLVCASPALAQVITTVAGTTFSFPSQPVPALNAPLGNVAGVATDAKGNVYFTDSDNNLVLKIGPDGNLSVVAGNVTNGPSKDSGPATSVTLSGPSGLAVDSAGAVYVAEFYGHRVRKIAGGIITTFAGNGGSFGDNGPATSAQLSYPSDVAVDAAGNVYIADSGNNRIRKVSNGIITTFAGNGTAGFSGDGVPPATTELNGPSGVAVDAAGDLYIADTTNYRIRKVSGGLISTIAGNGTFLDSGDGGPALSATLGTTTRIAIDSAGNLYTTEPNQLLMRKISASGIITTFAGNGGGGFSGDLGPATSATINPTGVATDSAGNVYIADGANFRIRKVSGGTIITIAGNGDFKFSGDDGRATAATLHFPSAVAIDSAGSLYIADTNNNRIRKVSGGVITTSAGNGLPGFSGDKGPATSAQLNFPTGIAVDSTGVLYIADTGNNRIRKVVSGTITTIAGNGTAGFSGDGGPAADAMVSGPMGVAVDSAGNLYIADYYNNRIRKISGGNISTFAGNGMATFSGDGGLATKAALNAPVGVAADAAGNVYIADKSNHRIRKVSSDGIITTIAGNGTSGDGGPATSAALSSPVGVAVDSTGGVYISDNSQVRKVSGTVINTLAGNGNYGFSGDGGPATSAALNGPVGIAVDSTGNVFIADHGNDRVRYIPSGPVTYQTSVATLNFSVIAGGFPSPVQTFLVSPSVPGLAFSAASVSPWLNISPASGFLPASIQVSVDPTSLTAGTTYASMILIKAPSATPQVATINVSVLVSPAIPGSLAVGSSSLAFSFPQGANPGTQQLTITNPGSGSIGFTASASTTTGGNWLSVAATSGTSGIVTPVSPASLTVTANPGNLAAGSYSGTITVASPDTGQQIIIPVTLAISVPAQRILLSQLGFTFTAVAQGGSVPAQSLGILNTGSGTLNYSVQATILPGASGWLSVSANSGTVIRPFLDVSFVNVRVDAHSLAPGTYYGQLAVSAAGASNSPQTAVVVLTVLPPGSNPGPDVRPTGLVFTGVAGDVNPNPQNVTVTNLTANPTTFYSSITNVGNGSVRFQPTDATVAPNAPVQMVLQPDFTGLAAGQHRAALTLAFYDGAIQNVSILSVVAPAGTTGQAIDETNRAANGSCTPTTLLPQFTQAGFGSIVTVGYPALIGVKVVDDCGLLMTDGSVVVSFNNGDPPLSLVSLQDGNWTSSWQPGHPASTVTLSAEARLPALNLIGTAPTATVGLQQSGQGPPVLSGGPGGVGTAAGSTFAPGDLMLLKGTGLANGPASSTATPLQQQLAGASVYVGGSTAPLLYADTGQVLALVPPDLPLNTSQQVVLQRDNALGIPVPVIISAAHPAILTKDGSGQGQGLIYAARPAATTLADASNPVKAGDTIIVYCSGLGTKDATGIATNTPQLTIAGQPAQVSYAGVALAANYPAAGPPTVLGGLGQVGFGGLYQITATVPGGLFSGQASITITSAGQSSPAGVTLAITGASASASVITSINTAYGSADISQNDFIEIHGTNLAAATAGPAALTAQLVGTSVTVNGKSALLYYVSPTQINALTPLDNTTGSVTVQVINNGTPSASFIANLRTVTQAFLWFEGNGHITATHADGSYLGPASLGPTFTPAKPGDTIVTYAVGFGLPSTPLVSGSPSQSGSLPTLPVCQISGAPATVTFAGLNGFAGLYQLNLVVPTSAADGDNPVSCTYGGQSTPPGSLLTIQR